MKTGSREAAANYYRTLTGLYRWYGASAHGWHYGIYDQDVDGHAASLKRCNDLLLEGLDGAGKHLLDVGCGEGGFSVWAAARGFTVTGCTLCLEHVPLARTLAQASDVAHRCRFLLCDMNDMPFAPGSFDVVVNQETWCYAQAKAAYLKGVRRLLRPGGVFRAVDLALGDTLEWSRFQRQYRDVCDGFQIPSLISKKDAIYQLAAAGFSDISVVDLTAKVQRSALLILAFSAGPRALTAVGLDRWLYGSDKRVAGVYRGHVAACMAFNRGLRSGVFRYLYLTARNPLL